MKKYIYKPQNFIPCQRVKWTEKDGLEELDSFISNYTLKQIFFDTLDELKEKLVEQCYSIDFNDEGDVIFVHWYENKDGCPVNIDKSDSDWKAWCDGKISLWEYSLCIEATDIYLNQTLDSLDELR